MRTGTKVFLGTSLGFASGIALTIAFERLYAADGFLKNSIDAALMPPITPTKILIVVTAAIVLTALPLAILEWRSERAYVKIERDMRAARPADAVTRYEGTEGRGYLFDGPDGRALLLEPAGGIGAPRVVALPPVPLPAAESEAVMALPLPDGDAPTTHGEVP